MKLDYKKTIFVGLAFMLISMFWQAYDNLIGKILIDKFGLNQFFSGFVMALDNIFALFMLPLFGALSDKQTVKGEEEHLIYCGNSCCGIRFSRFKFC